MEAQGPLLEEIVLDGGSVMPELSYDGPVGVIGDKKLATLFCFSIAESYKKDKRQEKFTSQHFLNPMCLVRTKGIPVWLEEQDPTLRLLLPDEVRTDPSMAIVPWIQDRFIKRFIKIFVDNIKEGSRIYDRIRLYKRKIDNKVGITIQYQEVRLEDTTDDSFRLQPVYHVHWKNSPRYQISGIDGAIHASFLLLLKENLRHYGVLLQLELDDLATPTHTSISSSDRKYYTRGTFPSYPSPVVGNKNKARSEVELRMYELIHDVEKLKRILESVNPDLDDYKVLQRRIEESQGKLEKFKTLSIQAKFNPVGVERQHLLKSMWIKKHDNGRPMDMNSIYSRMKKIYDAIYNKKIRDLRVIVPEARIVENYVMLPDSIHRGDLSQLRDRYEMEYIGSSNSWTTFERVIDYIYYSPYIYPTRIKKNFSDGDLTRRDYYQTATRFDIYMFPTKKKREDFEHRVSLIYDSKKLPVLGKLLRVSDDPDRFHSSDVAAKLLKLPSPIPRRKIEIPVKPKPMEEEVNKKKRMQADYDDDLNITTSSLDSIKIDDQAKKEKLTLEEEKKKEEEHRLRLEENIYDRGRKHPLNPKPVVPETKTMRQRGTVDLFAVVAQNIAIMKENEHKKKNFEEVQGPDGKIKRVYTPEYLSTLSPTSLSLEDFARVHEWKIKSGYEYGRYMHQLKSGQIQFHQIPAPYDRYIADELRSDDKRAMGLN